MTGTRRRRRDATHEVASGLGPAEAGAAHAALLEALEGAGGAATVELSAEPATPSPLALQLLEAARRTRRLAAPRFGPRATAALDTLGRMMAINEGQA